MFFNGKILKIEGDLFTILSHDILFVSMIYVTTIYYQWMDENSS